MMNNSIKNVIDNLESLFSKFNRRYFNNELLTPVITVSPDTTSGAYGWCTSWKAWQSKPLARGYAVKYTDAWCATFVSACAIKCGYTDIIPTECGCSPMIQLFKNLGEWVENDAYVPKSGDIIFYDWQDSGSGDNTGVPDHVGIVESVSGSTITVIEGNKNNSVARRIIQANGKYIRGYGVPKYDVETTSQKELTSANDITWELNHSYFPILEIDNFVKALDEAKKANSPLYWGYYKLVNKVK